MPSGVCWGSLRLIFFTFYFWDPHLVAFDVTPRKTNIAPENGWLEYYFPLGNPIFRCYVTFREGILYRLF